MDGQIIGILRLWIYDDADRLHVKIDNLNDLLVGLCFIRSIDERNTNFISTNVITMPPALCKHMCRYQI
jgi:hypothetical protein